jgi:predicted dehydrogenase
MVEGNRVDEEESVQACVSLWSADLLDLGTCVDRAAGLQAGGLAHFEIAANVHGEWSEGADIYGERGSVRLRTHFPFALRASDVEVFDEVSTTGTRPVFGDTNAYERQIEAFARSVRTGTATTPDAADGVAAVRLIDAVAESVGAAGAVVTL